MKKAGKVLFITEIEFYPMFGGERMRTYGLLKILSNTYDRVYALTSLKNPGEAVKEQFPNVEFRYFDFSKIRTVITHFGYFAQFRQNREFLESIDGILASDEIDTAFIDYKYYGQYISFLKKKGLKVIYGTHNVQSRIMWQKPSSGLNEFFLNKMYYITHYIHEKIYFDRANKVIAVSDHDADYYGRYIDKSKIVTLPNFLDEEMYGQDAGQKEDYIVMTANFMAFQNEVGISWFLRNVWTDAISDRIQLVLAGIGSREVLDKLNSSHPVKNVVALGKLDDLKDIIKKAKISIVPLLDGSGTRLKCIESMALKTQIISTSRGAEGIDHEGGILIADTPEDFRQRIVDVLDNKVDMTETAWDVFMKKYSYTANQKIFSTMLETL